MTYCSSVWGHCNCDKLEQVYFSAMRAYMGIHKFAPLLGIIGDMGWSYFKVYFNTACTRLWNRLIKMDDTRLTKIIFLYNYKTRLKNTWCVDIQTLFQKYQMQNVYNDKVSCDLVEFKDTLDKCYSLVWKEEIYKKPKLRFYVQFKNDFHTESYIKINLSSKEKSYLSQLRLGILPIAIETGRYRQVPISERKCIICIIYYKKMKLKMNFTFYLSALLTEI